jgi:hypothetical protein
MKIPLPSMPPAVKAKRDAQIQDKAELNYLIWTPAEENPN